MLIFGILLLGFFAVALSVPSCRWLIFGAYRPTHCEENLCRIFCCFIRNTAILMLLLFLGRSYMGNLADAIVAVLMLVLIAVLAWKLLHNI